jgi:hypothetical protein
VCPGVPHASDVRLEIFDVAGRKVATLIDGKAQAGQYAVQWNGAGYASGIYLARLQSENHTFIRKMMLLK